MAPRPSDEPTLYYRTLGRRVNKDVPLDRVVVVQSRLGRRIGYSRWWAFRPPFGEEAVHAPTYARVLELAEEEWGT